MTPSKWLDEPDTPPYDDEPLDEDWSDDDTSETLPCPECGADVYEDAERCPVCGTYILRSNNVLHGRPWWWIVLGVLGILAIIFVFALGF